MPPLVSVLTYTRNRATYLPAMIEGVLAQEMSDFELVISDNASTDDTEAIVRRYAASDPRIRYFRNPANVGATNNVNLCYQRSDPGSRYFVMHPSDDWWEPSFLARTVAAAETNPPAAFVHTDAYRTDADGHIINRYSDVCVALPQRGYHRAIGELFQGNYVLCPAVLINREIQRQIWPVEHIFRPGLSLTPDYDLYVQLLCRGQGAVYLDEPLVYFRKHEGAMTMPANVLPRLEEEIRTLELAAEVCPPELERRRQEALQDRWSRLAFLQLEQGRPDPAKASLREAQRRTNTRRLDLTVARAISLLPVPSGWRSLLWSRALSLSSVVARRARRDLTEVVAGQRPRAASAGRD